MKPGTRHLLAGLGVLLAGLPLGGTETKSPTPTAPPVSRLQLLEQQRMQELDGKLHLTAEQKEKIQQIWTKAAAAGRALQEEHVTGKRAKRREIMRTTHEEVRSVLTPEQQKKFDEMPRRARRFQSPDRDAEGR